MEAGKRIVFLDIDGTLTEPGMNVVPQSALEAIGRCRAEGNLVFLSTGRNYNMLQPVLEYGFDGVVASGGGYIEVGEEPIFDCPMSEEQRRLAVDVLERNGIFRTIECKEGSFTDQGFKAFLREKTGGGNSELVRWREQIEKNLNIRPMEEYGGAPVYKIVMMGERPEQFEEPRAVLDKDFLFCIQESDRFGVINGELVNRMFDKGQAIRRVCEYLGIPLEDTVAFGDSMNDKEMLETAGISVCMGNGAQALKKIADLVCPSVKEDGLLWGFEKLGLCG